MVNNHWLVVWNMAFIFHSVGNVIIPTDEVHHFSEGFKPPTSFDRDILLTGHRRHRPGHHHEAGAPARDASFGARGRTRDLQHWPRCMVIWVWINTY